LQSFLDYNKLVAFTNVVKLKGKINQNHSGLYIKNHASTRMKTTNIITQIPLDKVETLIIKYLYE